MLIFPLPLRNIFLPLSLSLCQTSFSISHHHSVYYFIMKTCSWQTRPERGWWRFGWKEMLIFIPLLILSGERLSERKREKKKGGRERMKWRDADGMRFDFQTWWMWLNEERMNESLIEFRCLFLLSFFFFSSSFTFTKSLTHFWNTIKMFLSYSLHYSLSLFH